MKKKNNQVVAKVLLWGASLLIALALISGVIIFTTNITPNRNNINIPKPGPRIPPVTIMTTAFVSTTPDPTPAPAPPPTIPTPKIPKIS